MDNMAKFSESEILWINAMKWALHQEYDQTIVESQIKSFERNLIFFSSEFLTKLKDEIDAFASFYHINLNLWNPLILVLNARIEALKPENIKSIYLGRKRQYKKEVMTNERPDYTDKKARPWPQKAIKCGKYTLIGMHALRVNK